MSVLTKEHQDILRNTGTSSIAACNGQTRMSLPAFLDTEGGGDNGPEPQASTPKVKP